MIKRIGRCVVGVSEEMYSKEFEFPDNYTEEEMKKELFKWANIFVEAWFEEEKYE